MHLRSLDVKNFRGFDELLLDDIGQVNIIIGRNNSGKTSLLEAIVLASTSAYDSVLFDLNRVREIGSRDLESLLYIFYKLDFSNNPSINATFGSDAHQENRSINIEANSASDAIINQSLDNLDKVIDPSLNFSPLSPINQIEVFTRINGENKTFFSLTYISPEQLQVKRYGSLKQDRFVSFVPSTVTDHPTLERIGYLIKLKKTNVIVSALRLVDDRIQNITIIDKTLYFDLLGFDKLLPFSLMGDGIKKIVSCLISIIETNSLSTILIDEIENGLHYSAHLLLWNSVLTLVKETGAQLFVTTHNVETLRYLQQTLESNPSVQPDLRVFDLVRTKKTGYQAYKYTYEGLSSAIESGNEIRL